MKKHKSKAKGPLETVTEKGVNVHLYSTPTTKAGKVYPGHTLIYTAAGKRKREFVADLEKARTRAKEIAAQLGAGIGHAHVLSATQAADTLAALQAIRPLGRMVTLAEVATDYVAAAKLLPEGSTLRDAVHDFSQRHSKTTIKMTTKVADVVAKFCEDKEKEEVSTYYLKPLRGMLERFAAHFRCSIYGIEAEEIKAWIEANFTTRNTRIHRRDDLATLFRWARNNGYLPEDRRTAAEKVSFGKPTRRSIGTYTPAELRAILYAAPSRLVPVIAIAAFAGVRSKELFELDWSAIRLRGTANERHIELTPENAKTKIRRSAPVLPSLVAWLLPYEKKSGRVSPSFQNLDNMTRLITKAVEAAGVKPQKNGFRHSFGTYRLAVTKNASQTSYEMGNSVRKLLERYNNAAPKAEGVQWFKIVPPKNEKIVPFKSAAV
jgi:integrase